MTRKDYELFARMYRGRFKALAERSESMPAYKAAARSTTAQLMKETADIFAGDNPRFNREKFYSACTTY